MVTVKILMCSTQDLQINFYYLFQTFLLGFSDGDEFGTEPTTPGLELEPENDWDRGPDMRSGQTGDFFGSPHAFFGDPDSWFGSDFDVEIIHIDDKLQNQRLRYVKSLTYLTESKKRLFVPGIISSQSRIAYLKMRSTDWLKMSLGQIVLP